MSFEVLPLRAVVFQCLFLLIAIAIEAYVLHRTLSLDYKTSMQYAVSVNLLSTFLGWICFFLTQPLLPLEWRVQLISFIFFEHFYADPMLLNVAPVLVFCALGMFLGTFLVKLKGLDFLDILLEKNPKPKATSEVKPMRFRGRQGQLVGVRANSRVYAVLVANACSFSAILLLLFFRLVEQSYLPR
ncbi:filament integrity protein fraC [Leptolyngbya sp. FACHB-321]|uniref:filament integrity protein FraC n=1 Tax=Leptolyngbya sp. FACHB-321 TaxID=2692807 RepID=UPI0016838414|nr:filament integrity protein FraC [Leptolyngbya sp. FACHB-321]MBD2038666.1 filament integrity protein fraC [Leptolyngbya sp. FACHB-321]